jgi:hypothetical protein
VLVLAVFCAGDLSVSEVEAALFASESGETVYDTVSDITWLSSANLAATKNFGVRGINPDGSMAWTTAQNWIAAMNTANYLGSINGACQGRNFQM